MKILMMTPSYDPIIGGTETVVKNLTITLNRIGVEADVMTFNMDRKWEPNWKFILEEKCFKVYRISALNLFGKKTCPIGDFFKLHVLPDPSFRRILKDYDLLHFHDVVDLTLPLFSSFIKKPRVFHCHTLQEIAPEYKKSAVLRRALLKSSDLFLTVSSGTARLAKELGADRIRMLPNGVDIDKFTIDPTDVPTQDREENLVLFVGRLESRKGIHVLLSSLDLLKTPVNLVLVGPNYSDEYSRKILSQVENEKRKGKHTIAYRGSPNLDDLVKWYKKASIFVCPSLCETFGIVNIEAMSCGTPVIASDIEGIRDIIENGKDGLLVPPNNPSALAGSVQYLLDNENVRTKLGKEGRKKVEREFSWRAIAEKLCGIYDEILS
jgi:glycosyltransferase involved in cell wall biosynthesis